MELFLGDCLSTAKNMYIQWQMNPGAILSFANQLTTRLDKSTLKKESRINQDDDAACRLFNRVHHIYNQINVVHNREQEITSNTNPDNMKDVLDKVMEYKPSRIVPDMDNHSFNVDEEEEEEGDDNEVVDVSNGGNMTPCLLNLWDVGWDELAGKCQRSPQTYS
jgi:hypothetical protein